MDFKQLLRLMRERQASDLHIRAYGAPFLRIDGNLNPVPGIVMSPKLSEDIAHALIPVFLKPVFAQNNECDFSFALDGVGRFRVSVYRQRGTVNLAIRSVSSTIPNFEELRLPAVMGKLAQNARGLVLVTGTAGSGKSTTLAAMVGAINETRACHIITIEDPIEFLHQDKKAIVTQRELGQDTSTFAQALRTAVRQDPDVIMVGEMRDLETTSAALTAAQTGHLVLSTLHTIDAIQTIARIVDLFPPHQQLQVRLQLADTLKGVVSQRLLPCAHGGRVPAVEVLSVTAHIKKMIEENNLNQIAQAISKGEYYGMRTFNQALVKLYREGMAKLEDVVAMASNPEDVLLDIRGIESGAGVEVKK
ncbi:MAG: PilT/PilU family type 4a pilus ATPase [Elusimicrobia bacterium]|nr:PilT/PilU family type 4a pilus ATPase [Elusimicrobiota bacterium]